MLPVVAFNYWLNGLLDRKAEQEVHASAQRTIMLSEKRLTRAISSLDGLTSRGIDSCRQGDINALRQATFATTPIKELSVVAPDGRTLCTDGGNPSDTRNLLWSEPAAAGSDILLELVRLGDMSREWLRVRRVGKGKENGVAALIPAELFIAQTSNQGGSPSTYTRLMTASGAVIGAGGTPPSDADRDDRVNETVASNQFALKVEVSLTRGSVVERDGDLRALGAVINGFLAVILLGMSRVLPKRSRDNPIAELERALSAGEFIPYYQPIVDIRSGRLRGAEVLMRWRKSDGSIVSPATFIPLAESSGLILELTRELMRKASHEMGTAFGARPHLKLAFNLTARHVADEEIVADVRKIFGKSRLKLNQLVLEVTERQPIENLTETRRVIAALQGIGVRVAIDDVGSGHSGLSYMLKLGVDSIKIDKIFIDAIGTDRASNTIIETLIDLAQNMRMDIVAEGVETFEQVVLLRDLGIRAAQGYVFAPPLPGGAFLELVEAIEPLKKPELLAPTAESAAQTRVDAA